MRILFVFGVLYFFSFAAQSAVDYSRCRAYVQPQGFSGTPQRVGVPGGIGVPLPFTINANGTLTKKDFADIKTEENGKIQKFSFKIPGYSGVDAEGSKVEYPETTYEYVVTRDDKGRITKITNGPLLPTSRLQQMHQQQIDNYKENVPEDLRKQNDSRMGEGKTYEPPFFAIKGQSISFDYNGDKCFPGSATNDFFLEPKEDGAAHSQTVLDTHLCRDINEFLKANPEASACFRKDINDRMGMIFKKHAPKYESEAQGLFGYGTAFGGFGGHGGFGLGGWGGMSMMGNMAYNSISTNVLLSQNDWTKNLNDEGYLENARRTGSSPVMNGQRLLQNCFDVGARDIIEDEELWATAPVVESGGGGGADVKQR